MHITVFTVCYNEEQLLPFFLNHYAGFCDKIVVYDNESTDNSTNIIRNFDRVETEIRIHKTGNTIDDVALLEVKNNAWRGCESDYVIVLDVDEFLYHPSIKQYLIDTQRAAYRPQGYNMVSDFFPTYDKPITEQITEGVYNQMFSKSVIFSPHQVQDATFNPGSHLSLFKFKNGETGSLNEDPNLKLLHYKNLTFNYRYQKHRAFGERLCENNIQNYWGMHYRLDYNEQLKEYTDLFENKYKVI